MKAVRARVRNFRNIDDSGWFALEQVTAFVGRNEAGKTSLLKALHKFNPATPEPYDPQREFPRDRYTHDYVANESKGADWPVCSIEFEVSVGLQRRISQLLDDGHPPPARVTVTRCYDGSLDFAYAPALDEAPLAPDPVRDALQALASRVRRIVTPTADQEAVTAAQRSDLIDWAMGWNDKLARANDLRGNQGASLLRKLRSEANDKSGPQTADMMEALLVAVEPVLGTASEVPVVDQISALIERNLPALIYFENYGVLDSAVWLPQFLEDQERDALDSRVRTVDAIFKHVGLDPKEITELGGMRARGNGSHESPIEPRRFADEQRRREERAIQLNSASLDISNRFSTWWSQRRHRIRYHADGDYFRIWVADDRRTGVEIELEARSRGFQWFFSFYLVFLVESEAGHKNAILLLDEPGLHLHPTAQQELIAFLETLSQKNQLAYTTHSPFMIDGEHLHRVRPVSEDDTGHSRVAADAWPPDPETIFTLQAAAGYAMIRGLFRHRKSVLVEGMSDFYYLQMLSQQCARTGRTALPDDICITPCGGAKNIGHVASLFLARDIRPQVLLDGEDAGRVRRDALMKELYVRHGSDVMMLDTVLNRPGQKVAIEDILGEEVLAAALEGVLARPLALAKTDEPAASLPSRIEAAAKRQGLALPDGWRAAAALHLASSWAKDGMALDDGVLDTAASLFSALADRFEDMNGASQREEETSGDAVEDDPDLLGLLLQAVGEGQVLSPDSVADALVEPDAMRPKDAQ